MDETGEACSTHGRDDTCLPK